MQGVLVSSVFLSFLFRSLHFFLATFREKKKEKEKTATVATEMRRLMKQWRWWSSLAVSSLFLGMPILSADQTLVPPSARRLFQLGEHLHVREHVIARRSQSPTRVSPHEYLRHDAHSPHQIVDSSPLPITLLRLAFFFFQLCCDDF